MPAFRLPVRQLVEFLLRTGSIDSRFTGFDRANEGARIHRKLQKAAGEGYAAEVFLSGEREAAGIPFTIEGRADGIFTDEAGVTVIDEIKTTAVPADDIAEDMNPCHWAQGMVYGELYGRQQGLEKLDVRLTYYQIDTDDILRFVRHFTLEELEAFLQDLLEQYAPWAQRQLAWKEQRGVSLSELDFPFPAYRPGQRALAGEVYRACTAAPSKSGVRLFCQAPTGIGKTMSVLFPALRAIGTGCGEKLFYLTARNTTQSAAEDAIARLRASDPKLALRSVTLTAKEKVCLHPDAEGHPACLPELCPYANGYYDRVNTALKALLDDGTGRFDRAALADAANLRILFSDTFIKPKATPNASAITNDSNVINSVFFRPVSKAGIDCLTRPKKPTFFCASPSAPLSVTLPEIASTCSFAPSAPKYCATIVSYSPEAMSLFRPSSMAASRSAFLPLFTAMPYSPCGTFGVTIFKPLFWETP